MAPDPTLCVITEDQVLGAGCSLRYTPLGGPESIGFRRSVLVSNISAASGYNGSAGVTTSLRAVQLKYPVASSDPDIPLALVRGYEYLDGDSDTVRWGVDLRFDTIPWNTLEWTYESDTETEEEEVDQQYNLSGGSNASSPSLIPISIGNYRPTWYDPNSPIPNRIDLIIGADGSITAEDSGEPVDPVKPAEFGTVNADRTVKVLRYTRQMLSTTAALAFDKAADEFVGAINSTPFMGLTSGSAPQNFNYPAGYVKCRSARVIYQPFEAYYLAEAVFVYRKWAKWQPKAVYRDPVTGSPPANTWPADPDGKYEANGVVETTVQLPDDLNKVLALVTGAPQLPFG